jgi:uracil-DNA glycosylase family 4
VTRRPRPADLDTIGRRVEACIRCTRLVGYLGDSRKRYPDYWNRPVPGFGDPDATIAILGLAPGMHGANRSGRPFYMDASGEWLYGGLERLGLWDGARLERVHILNAVKCVPPGNRPLTEEVDRCRDWLRQEMAALEGVRVVLALGAIAHRTILRLWDATPLSRSPFRHGAVYRFADRPILLSSYHPSRQNTQTGVLTRRMWSSVLRRAVRLAA